MNSDPSQIHDQAVNQFIGLANQLKDNGADIRIISAAINTAAGIYNTYVEAGNQGFLQAAGVDKVCAAYRKQLQFIQDRKKAELKAAGHDINQAAPKSPA